MSRFTLVILLILYSVQSATAGGYLGNKMLEILGEDKTGPEMRLFKTQYLLDKALKNPELGIKLTVAYDSVPTISGITVLADGYELSEVKYKQYTGALPFDLSFADDQASLERKLGPTKAYNEEKLKFRKDGITVNVYLKKKKIVYFRFTQNIGMTGPYRLDGDHQIHHFVAMSEPAAATATPTQKSSTPSAKTATPAPNKSTMTASVDKNISALPNPAEFAKSTATVRTAQEPFYDAIMNVIESGEEEMFKDIKKEATPKANFWNYKYTYATSVAIPGEKYNMLYSFPFQSSQLDFVSVLEETDGENGSISAKYAEIEAKLKSYFGQKQGWSYHYTVNPEDPKGIKDFELKNSKLGSIVLDYSINPYGKHVLYLRFLLQYT